MYIVVRSFGLKFSRMELQDEENGKTEMKSGKEIALAERKNVC